MPNYPNHVTRELAFDQDIRRGDVGTRVKRVQEWLKVHGFATGIDSDFGPATEKCVKNFQHFKELPETGVVNQETWNLLVDPLVKALAPIEFPPDTKLAEAVLRVAEQHVKQHPIEVGGDNRGPWVRVYVDGNEGVEWRWCAAFVTFVIKQACMELEQPLPIEGSFSCDSLAYQAKQSERFVAGARLENGTVTWSNLSPTQIFLVRKTPTDWTHAGFSFGGQELIFSTIEGNSNENGSANGFEVTRRTRSIPRKDFINLS